MSKNLTRKGLALGATVALGSTLFAGAPAFAAEALTVAADLGTSTSFISGERFDLKVYPGAGSLFQFAGSSELRWEVLNPDAKSVTVTSTNASTPTATATGTPTAPASASTATTITVDPDGNAYTTPGGNKLGLAVAADVETTLKVRAYIENDGTAGLTAGDSVKSEQVEVKFIKQANVAANIAITAPVEADTTVTAKLSFTNINNEQLAQGDFSLEFTKGDDSSLGSTQRVTPSAWSTTDAFAATTGSVTALVKDSAVKVQAYYKNGGSHTFAAAEKIGSAATANVTARKVATFTADVVRSLTAKSDANTAHVLRNKEFEMKATAKDNASTPAAVAGSAVTVTVAVGTDGGNVNNVALSSATGGKTVTVNGTTYTDAAKLPGVTAGSTGTAKVATTTDADGVAKVKISTANFAVGDKLVVTFATENFTSSKTVMAVDASYTGYITNAVEGVSVVAGGAATLNIAVYDQFGGTVADEYDARAIWVSSNGRTTASTTASSNNVAIVGGKANLTVTDNGTGTGYNVYNVEFAKRQAGGGYSSNTAIDANFEVRIVSAANLVAGKITVTEGTLNSTSKIYEIAGPVALNLNATGSSDYRTNSTAPTITGGTTQTLSGLVTTAPTATSAAVAIEGAKVTVAGAGLQFRSGSSNSYVYSAGSIDVYTSVTGAYSVDVASNKAGKQTITITSGSFSQTVTVVFAAAAENTATAITLTAPATIEPGKTLLVSGVLADKYGNAVDTDQTGQTTTQTFSVAYDGPGLIVGDLPTATDADGKFAFRVLLGATDTGSATVTVKYDADGSTTTTTDAVTKTASIAIAAPVVVVPEVKTTIVGVTKAVRIRVENAKGEEVEVKFGSKTVAVAIAGTNSKLWVLKTTKGKKSVKVYVDGDLVAVKTVTVK
jgi:hypothetical protein